VTGAWRSSVGHRLRRAQAKLAARIGTEIADRGRYRPGRCVLETTRTATEISAGEPDPVTPTVSLAIQPIISRAVALLRQNGTAVAAKDEQPAPRRVQHQLDALQ
jgi:hypothetical protein